MDQAVGQKIADYLIKPVNPNQILLSIKKNLHSEELVSANTGGNYRQEFLNISNAISDWKNRTIYFLFHTEILSEHRTHRAPLIQTEIVYQYKKQFLSGVKSGKNTPAKNVGTHQRTPGLIRTGITTHPIFIVMAHKTAEREYARLVGAGDTRQDQARGA